MSTFGARQLAGDVAAARRGRVSRSGKTLALAVALTTLVGCSGSDSLPTLSLSAVTSMFELEPVAGWEPPGWSDDLGVTTAAHSDSVASPLAEETASLGNGDALGLMTGRIRNDTIGFAARYVQLPMRHRFNERMDELLWEAIGATGGSFTPEVFPETANLNDRGCVPGSLTWPAGRVLTEPTTGPTGTVGTAMTCEVLEAFGNILGVGVRVVSGNAEAGAESATIAVDRLTNIYINVSDGSIHEAIPRWSAEAPAALWQHVVSSLRRDVGGLSTAEIGTPAEDQVALAKTALDTARNLGEGQLALTVAPGITSPELVALGTEPTTVPIDVQVKAELAAQWVSAELAAIHADTSVPFVGLPAWNASLPVNCMLLACIAVTYDDGPSPMTPALLDTLWAQRAPTTFYMMGKAVAVAPDTVARAASEGHEIGSHTVTHPELTKLPKSEARAQVLDAAHAISNITGHAVTSFRPPYGDINNEIIAEVNLPAILWSIDTNDWKLPGKPALLERSVGVAGIGDIILFHDTHADTVDVANDVIVGLRNRGFALVTVTELFDGALPQGRVSHR